MKKFKVIEKSRFLDQEGMKQVTGGKEGDGCGIAVYSMCENSAYWPCATIGHLTCAEQYSACGMRHELYPSLCSRETDYMGGGPPHLGFYTYTGGIDPIL